MSESIQIALEIYLTGFVISILIAALIKGMQAVIRRLSPAKDSAAQTDSREE
ncbi:MAG TPA: hypothetical protein VN381_08435 [Anaerovoracaceae bacterium]|nr:hypothetical protein [Anaerovoracaceae bacterium]